MCNCSESQSNLAWKGRLETIWSELWLKAGPSRSGAQGRVRISSEYL